MKKIIFTAVVVLASVWGAFAQKYKDGGVSMYNAKGQKWSSTYHKLQIGVLFPVGTMPARKNVWYTKPRNRVTDGLVSTPAYTLRYAWSSNPNTEFIVQGDYEATQYYDEAAQNAITHTRDFYTLTIGVNYKWWQQGAITLYSGLLLGCGYGKYSDKAQEILPANPENIDRTNWFYPSAQLTAVGVTWGRKFGGFGELAFGSKGILNAGLYLKL